MASTFTIPRGLRLRPQHSVSLLYALFFVVGVGKSAIVPLLPRIGARYGLSSSETALLLALPGLATLAVSMPSGLAADRFGARRVTLGAGALLSLSYAAQTASSFALLLAGRLAFGISFGIVWTAGMAWLSEIDVGTPGRRLGPSVTFSSVGVMVGPAVGGLLAERAGLGVPFMAIAAVAAAVTGGLGLSSADPSRSRADPHAGSEGSRADPHAGSVRPHAGHDAAPAAQHAAPGPVAPRATMRTLPALLREPRVGAAAAALVVSGAASGATQLLITIGLHRRGASVASIGFAFSAAAVFYIAGSGLVARLGERARNLRFNAIATLMIALALLPALADGAPAVLVLALMLTAVPRAAVGTIAYALPSPRDGERGGEQAEGVVFGMLNGGWAAATVLSPMLVGMLDQHEGARAAYLAVILPSLAIAAWLLGGSRESRPVHRGGADLYRDLGTAVDSEPASTA